MAALLQELAHRHASVGAVRSLGLFGLIELVRDRETRAAARTVQWHIA